MRKFTLRFLALIAICAAPSVAMAQCNPKSPTQNPIVNCPTAKNLQQGDYVLGYQNSTGATVKIPLSQLLGILTSQQVQTALGYVPAQQSGINPPVFSANALQATNLGTTSVTLQCSGVTGTVTTFQFLEQPAGTTNFSPVGSPASTCGPTTINGLTSGASYLFEVIASGPGGIATSGSITVTTTPTAPGSFVLGTSAVTSSGVTLTWSQPSGTIPFQYQPQVEPGTATVFSNIGTQTGALSQVITGLSPATLYNFQVLATNAASTTGVPSSVATITTPSGGGGGCTPPTGSVWNSCAQTGVTVTGANLIGTTNIGTASGIVATNSHGSGKWYFTITPTVLSANMRIGLGNSSWVMTTALGANTNGEGVASSGTVTGAASSAGTATWSPTDKASTITVSGSNLIATTSDGVGEQAIRGTLARSTGKFQVEYTFGTSTGTIPWGGDVCVGIANALASLNAASDPAFDTSNTNTLCLYPNFNSQVYMGGAQISPNGSAADTTGAVITLDFDFAAKKLWYTTTAMRAAGKNWNWDVTANQNPSTSLGGIDFSAIGTGPWFPFFNAFFSDPVTVNTGGSAFTTTLPTGYSAWNATGSTSVASFAVNNTVGVAVDFDNSLEWFQTNSGNWNNVSTANPATGAGGISISNLAAGPYFPAVSDATNADSFTANFGGSATPNLPAGFLAWNGAGGGGGTGVQAQKARSMIDSMGVNTHFQFNWGGYSNPTQGLADIQYLGITHLRENGPFNGAAAFVSAGIKFNIITNPNDCSQYPAALSSAFSTFGSAIELTEGPNELNGQTQTCNGQSAIDSGNGAEGTVARLVQQTFWNDVRANSNYNGIPAINVSLVWPKNNLSVYLSNMGNLSAFADYGNWHEYDNPAGQSGQPLANRLSAKSFAQQTVPNKPWMITEWGYQTISSPNSGFSLATDAVIAKMDLQDWLDGYLNMNTPGVCATAPCGKSYIYELYDTNAENQSFGLINDNAGFAKKTQAVAVHNFTTIFADAGSQSFTPGKLAYSISNPGAASTLLFQKSSGVYLIPVWNEPLLWNTNNTAANPSPVAETFTANGGAAVTRIDVFDPLVGTTSVQNCTACASLAISGGLTGGAKIIQVTP